MIVRRKLNPGCKLPDPISGIERVTHMKVLGITIQHNLKMEQHVSNIVAKANSDMFALKTLKCHGLEPKILSQVCRATLVARITYASPAWRGFCTASDLSMMEAVDRKARRWGLYSPQASSLTDILDQADKDRLSKILANSNHVLYPLLPPKRSTSHNLRPRGHIHCLPTKTNFSLHNFIIRMLYSFI